MTNEEREIILERIRRIDPRKVPVLASAVTTAEEVAQAFKDVLKDRVDELTTGGGRT